MPHSKRSHEGYLLIDNSASPGVSADLIRQSGKDVPIVGEGQKFESAVITCSHCHKGVIVNPDRTRSRGYCPKCDHYVCDECEVERVVSGECKQHFVERAAEKIAKRALILV